MDTPGWADLLRSYANTLHPENPLALEIFKDGNDDDDWPSISSRLEKEFNQHWLTHPDYSDERDKFSKLISSGVSPFKLSIAKLFHEAKPMNADQHLIDELATLSNVAKRSVAGVITTNYDTLMENIFKGYETYIGQEQLLFSATQGVAEIYKIHGCCKEPNSIVINSKDYEAFNSRNAYLAAKLLTVFVEHPIIFLGYSISDPNVQTILASITACLSQENLSLLKKRLIFVEYSFEKLESPEISTHSISFGDDTSLEMTRIKLNDYLPLYSSLLSQKFQYNPKLLRQLKRDIYKLVATNEQVDRFVIADIEDDNDLSNYEVVVGVGKTVSEEANNGSGHSIPEAQALFHDIIFDDGDFDIKSLVENALPKLLNYHSHSLPIHKYVSKYRELLEKEPPFNVLKDIKTSCEEFLSNGLLKQRESSNLDTLEQLDEIADNDEKKIRLFSLFKPIENHIDDLKEFIGNYLDKNPDVLGLENTGAKTDLKRLIKIYDWLVYGKKKTP